jgi:hypothetical protein
MVYYQTKNPILGKFLRASDWKMTLRSFRIIYSLLVYIVCGHLVYFLHFGMFGPRKIWQPRPREGF